jgi:hypothetical protein
MGWVRGTNINHPTDYFGLITNDKLLEIWQKVLIDHFNLYNLNTH